MMLCHAQDITTHRPSDVAGGATDYGYYSNAKRPLQKLQPVPMDASSRTECLPGTRADLLTSMLQWTNDMSGQTSVYWLNSPAGVGKSTIATTIANKCRAGGRLGAFLFFDRDVAQGNDPGLVIRTMAYQLGSYDRGLGASICAAIENTPDGSFPTFREQFQQLIVKPLLATRRPITPDGGLGNFEDNRPLVVVIDALDECGNPATREDLLSVLAKETATLSSVLRVIVTSRAVSDIRDSFGRQGHILPYELDASSDTNTADIQRYLWHRAKELRDTSKYLRLAEDWPGDYTMRSLTIRARGLFIWADIAWKFINAHNPQRRMEMLLRGQAPLTSDASLKMLYETALESAGDWSDSRFVNDFRMILGVVIMVKIPLSYTAIDQILHQSNGKATIHTISRLRYFLSQSPTVRLFHSSFAEFLSTRAQCGRDIWFIDPATHSRALAIHCLELLNSTLKWNICGLSLSPRRLENERLSEGLTYACTYWVAHICDVENDIRPVLVQLDTFLTQHLLHWFEAMSILRRSRDTIAMLNRLSAWMTINIPTQSSFLGLVRNVWHVFNNFVGYTTTNSSNLTSLCELANDACLFSQAFAKSIEDHPLLVYYGALPFSPITSTLYQQYHNNSLFPTVVGGFLHSWSLPQVVVTEHRISHTPDGSLGGDYFMSPDNTVYDVTSWTSTIPLMHEGQGSVQSAAFSDCDKSVTSGSRDDTAGSLEGHTHGVTSVVFSPDGHRVVSGSCDGSICMWDVRTGRKIRDPFQGHIDRVTCLAFSPDGKQVASGFRDGVILLWHAGQTITESFTNHTDWVTSVAFSSDGKRMVSGSRDRTVRIWDIHRHTTISLQGHTDWVRSVAFSPDGKQVVSGSIDRTVRIWDAQTGQTVSGPFECRKDWVHAGAFSPDGTKVVSRSTDISAHGWDEVSGTLSPTNAALEGRSIMSHYISCYTIEVNRDGWLIHVTTNRIISKLPSMISPLCSASSGRSVVVGTRGGQVIIIDFPPAALTRKSAHGRASQPLYDF